MADVSFCSQQSQTLKGIESFIARTLIRPFLESLHNTRVHLHSLWRFNVGQIDLSDFLLHNISYCKSEILHDNSVVEQALSLDPLSPHGMTSLPPPPPPPQHCHCCPLARPTPTYVLTLSMSRSRVLHSTFTYTSWTIYHFCHALHLTFSKLSHVLTLAPRLAFPEKGFYT
jgi:hypothetical protein